jgi:hypothetical protein
VRALTPAGFYVLREGTHISMTDDNESMPAPLLLDHTPLPLPVSDPLLDNPPAMDFDRVIHGIGSQVGAIGPLHSTHDDTYPGKDARIV